MSIREMEKEIRDIYKLHGNQKIKINIDSETFTIKYDNLILPLPKSIIREIKLNKILNE